MESSFREGGGFRCQHPKKLFTREFRDEAVRLAQTSGRSRREIAADLGIGLSTLRNWIDRRRDRQMEQPPPDRQEDMAAELKRLRRENEVLRQDLPEARRAPAASFDPPSGIARRILLQPERM